MKLEPRDQGLLGTYAKYPTRIKRRELRRMADWLLAASPRGGRPPTAQPEYPALTSGQLQARRRLEVPVDMDSITVQRDPDSGLYVAEEEAPGRLGRQQRMRRRRQRVD